MKISVLVSTYNWPAALRLCILSLLRQSVLPSEIVVADDGSTDETRLLIEELRAKSPIPIKHIWHDDEGFRRTVILNKAIAAVGGDYILQVDGDVIASRHFVSDHLELAEQGYFVCGSRVLLPESTTQKALADPNFRLRLWGMKASFVLNSLRCRPLRHFMARRYGQKKIDHLRGCNMAFWKNDIIKVNGYNEDLLQWGHEDGELAFRLHFAGVKKKMLKMGGAVYHLHHKESDRSNEAAHIDAIERVKAERLAWCENGINKYL